MINKDSYICYNWFPIIADHCLDFDKEYYKSIGVSRLHSKQNFLPEDVKDNDIIFVKTDYIFHGHFQNTFLQKINKKFILLSGGSSYHIGSNGDQSYKKILDSEHLIKWFCTNSPNLEHEKIVPLPIGFEEYEREGGNQFLLDYMRNNRIPFKYKKDKILLPYHNFETNPKRKELFELLSKNPFVEVQTQKLSFSDYLSLLNNYKFVICLEGSGPDVHRNYECLLLDSIPINISNNIEKLFHFYGLPNVFVKSWQTLNFEQISNTINLALFDNVEKFLNIGYHIDNIMRIKNEN